MLPPPAPPERRPGPAQQLCQWFERCGKQTSEGTSRPRLAGVVLGCFTAALGILTQLHARGTVVS